MWVGGKSFQQWSEGNRPKSYFARPMFVSLTTSMTSVPTPTIHGTSPEAGARPARATRASRNAVIVAVSLLQNLFYVCAYQSPAWASKVGLRSPRIVRGPQSSPPWDVDGNLLEDVYGSPELGEISAADVADVSGRRAEELGEISAADVSGRRAVRLEDESAADSWRTARLQAHR